MSLRTFFCYTKPCSGGCSCTVSLAYFQSRCHSLVLVLLPLQGVRLLNEPEFICCVLNWTIAVFWILCSSLEGFWPPGVCIMWGILSAVWTPSQIPRGEAWAYQKAKTWVIVHVERTGWVWNWDCDFGLRVEGDGIIILWRGEKIYLLFGKLLNREVTGLLRFWSWGVGAGSTISVLGQWPT